MSHHDCHCHQQQQQQQQLLVLGHKHQNNINAQSVCDTQIFLDSIDDIFGTIEGHLKFIEKNKDNKDHWYWNSKTNYNNELLSRIDAFINSLKIFSLSCFALKQRNESNALKLGMIYIENKYGKYLDKEYTNALLYSLKNGIMLDLPKRIKKNNEKIVNLTQNNMSKVLSNLIGGQHKINDKQSKYLDNYENIYNNHKKWIKIPISTKLEAVKYPVIQDIYRAFSLYKERFAIGPDLMTIDDEKEVIKLEKTNGIILELLGVIKEPVCCNIIDKDINSEYNDKILIQLGNGQKYRAPKKDIVFYSKENEKKISNKEYEWLCQYGKIYYQPIVNKNVYETAINHFKLKEDCEDVRCFGWFGIPF